MNFDWYSLFIPNHSIGELLLRGSIMYLALFIMLRVLVRRRVGALSMTDLLVIVLIADAAQNGMAGEYKSITEGVILCGTIIAWCLLLDWIAFHVPALRDWLEPPSRVLITNGHIQWRHMREEWVTEEELMSQLRQHGIDNVNDVACASVEPDGEISVIKRHGAANAQSTTDRRKRGQT